MDRDDCQLDQNLFWDVSQVIFIIGRDENLCYAGPLGSHQLLRQPADRGRCAAERDLAGHSQLRLLKQTKQQINALCLRHGKIFEERSRWTPKHVRWLHSLKLDNPVLQETLEEYLVTYEQLADKVERFDKRIGEFAQQDEYRERVNMLVCFKGIKVHTALSFVVEIGDFKRFPTAGQFASFLGLVPGEHSRCKCCGFKDDADHVGSINICDRAKDDALMDICNKYGYNHNIVKG